MQVLIAAGGRTVSSMEHRRGGDRNLLLKNKIHHSEIGILILDFLIITKNLGGLAAMQEV